jgi:hypothetical protein
LVDGLGCVIEPERMVPVKFVEGAKTIGVDEVEHSD